jgi:hypothetical protein
MSEAAYEFEPEHEGSTTEQVKERAQEVVGQVKETASSTKDRVGDRLTRVVQERSTQTGEQAIKMAESIRQSVGSMREQGQDAPAKLAEQAADRVQAVGLYLRDNDGDRILGDIEDFARRQPLVVAAGAFVIGLAGARFLKASSARRHQPASTTEATFGGQMPTPPVSESGFGVGGQSGMEASGAIDVVPPPPIDPSLDEPTDFGVPTTPGTGRHAAPPTTATP